MVNLRKAFYYSGVLVGLGLSSYLFGVFLGMTLNTIERHTKEHPSVFVEPLQTPKKNPFNNLG